jgi:hypothetical protein
LQRVLAQSPQLTEMFENQVFDRAVHGSYFVPNADAAQAKKCNRVC